MAKQETRNIEIAHLQEIWKKLEVDRLFRALKDRFEKPDDVMIYWPSMKEITLPRPYMLATYYRREEVPSHLSKSNRPFFDETDTVYRREYALALGASGFYARYRDNQVLLLEHPSRIRRPSSLQSLLEANITAERGRKPDWFTFLNNIPISPKK